MPMNDANVPIVPPPTPLPVPLTGCAKKNQQKREKDRAKRKKATVTALESPAPPVPSTCALQKAAQCAPVPTSFRAREFRATKPRWVGPAKPVDHPLLPYAHDVEMLKQHMQYVDWPGDKSHVILDRNGYVIGSLIAPPISGTEWATVADAATAAIRDARDKMLFPSAAFQHRRAMGEGFPTATAGFAFGGGRDAVGNIKATSATNAAAMDGVLADKNVDRMATFAIPAFQALFYHIFRDYHETKNTLLHQHPELRRTFRRSPFAALTVNLGPASVTQPHVDSGNKADGLCLITALGTFDPNKGGHIVLWDYNLIIRFPPGCACLIPSAVVTHSNTPIQAGEERFSLIQYSAGGLFRWRANGCQSDLDWLATASQEDVVRREEERKACCAAALGKFSRWKDVKVGNYSGRARLEVWETGELADFSDYTEEESDREEERPKKRRKRS
ncbi:hypothetical protein MSAN_00097600 [Mycena sanguinolenta]|uniref:Uncharacterized protein n=1 Tax=Mycena sanguinolenta TaxID=230812 RepID=A0A8H6ZFK8_9AGAR|nr:hypothetical protein MSAN_00097600 [Mycena sanguinolenta]